MTKQMKAAMAAMLMVGSLPMMAQQSQTDVVKVAPGQTKTTVIHRKNGATDTVISEGATTGKAHRRHVSGKRKAVAHRAPAESATAIELRELREKQTAQQGEIDALTQANAAKDAALQQAQTAAAGAEAQAQAATAQAQQVSTSVQANTDAVQGLKSNVTDLQSTAAGLATTISATKTELTEKIESPVALHYKGVTLTPTGFFALEGVYRTRSINSDLNTPFTTTPFPGSNEGHVSEFNLSGRQSRLGLLVEGNTGTTKLTGFAETDFLSAGVTSNDNQSNSYTLRVRQIWGRAETRTGFAVTGGQTWSLITEDGKGTDARTEKLPNTIDPSYMVGYNWTRQPTIRFQQKLGNPLLGAAVTYAFSLEQGQTQFSGANAPSNFIFGGAGQSGGLYNAFNGTYANNVAPDVITKIAFDTKYSHTEVGGMARFFRDVYYPLVLNTNGLTASYSNITQKDTKLGGGVFATTRVSASKYFDVAAQGAAGVGTGRYGAGQLGDVTAHPDGTLEPIKNYRGLFSLETHPSKRLDVYAYYGAEYNQRTVYLANNGQQVGYGISSANDTGCYALAPSPAVATGGTGVTGSPATTNCASSVRVLQEGTLGYTYKLINSPKYGILRYQFTYSYLQKTGWAGVQTGTIPAVTTSTNGHINYYNAGDTYLNPRATNNMIYGSLRYYIP